MNISLDVPLGKYREISDKEMKELNSLLEESTKTEEGSLPKTTNTVMRKVTPPPTKDKSFNRSKRNTEERPLKNERRNPRNPK